MKYPNRGEQCFANRFCKTLIERGAIFDVGLSGCYLLFVVAMYEDKAFYKRAVTFWNSQLMELCACSEKTLIKARNLAIQYGWLQYEPGAKARVGRYFVTIPDESFLPTSNDTYSLENLQGKGRQQSSESGGNSPANRAESVQGKGAPFEPIPIPVPITWYQGKGIAFPDGLDTPDFHIWFDAWIAQRRDHKPHSLSCEPDYLNRQLEKLAQLGPEVAIDCLRYTIDNDYKGIFPEDFPRRSQSVPSLDDPRGTIAMANQIISEMKAHGRSTSN